jgi:sigma-E factor negative regulatory protein RseC
MEANNQISHPGYIVEVLPELIHVQIITNSSCASCSVKGSCSVGEIEEKLVEVDVQANHSYKVGDAVTVVLDQSKGIFAILLGYVFPFLTLLITLIIMLSITDNQGLAGLVSLAMLLPYYGILFLFKRTIRRKFDFKLG